MKRELCLEGQDEPACFAPGGVSSSCLKGKGSKLQEKARSHSDGVGAVVVVQCCSQVLVGNPEGE